MLYLKLYCWLFAISFAALCASGWALSELVWLSLEGQGRIPPAVTQILIYPHWWIWVLPIPALLICAMLSARKSLSIETVLLFTGSVFLLEILIAASLAFALALPFIPLEL